MEWTLSINKILSDSITKLNYTLIPPGFQGDVRSVRLMQEILSKVIDNLGEQSAATQGLNKVITTAEKLRNSPTQILYLLKDTQAKGGNGDVIGLLKVGRKHLFLFNEQDKVCEVEPLCVLDFFVLRQRLGHGKILFDHMLKDQGALAQDLAIDGPSPKMEKFLYKNYGIDQLVRQNNNFAVSPLFFSTVKETNNRKSGSSTPMTTPTVGRFGAPKPSSVIANIIHGGTTTHQETSNGTSGRASPYGEDVIKSNGAATPVEPEPIIEAKTEAVDSPDNAKIEELADIQKSPERPSTLKVEPVCETPAPALSPAGSTVSRRDSQLTDRGYFDVKFYHNKLW